MRSMTPRARFARWIEWEIGSSAPAALRQHLRDRDYRVYSCMEHEGVWSREIYHPSRGFYRGTGGSESDALLDVLRQIWLVDSLEGVHEPEADPAQ